MRDPILTIRVWGYYAIAIGIAFAAIPNVVFDIFGIPTTEEVWIRVVGLISIDLGLVYLGGALGKSVEVVKATIWGRMVVVGGLVAVWIAGGPWQLVLFAAIDLVGLTWSWRALRAARAAAA